MQLTDHSALKRTEPIEIPLNGEIYWAVGDPPAEVPLESMGAFDADELRALAEQLTKQDAGEAFDETDPAAMATAARASAGALSHTQRAMVFMAQVLVPESAERWLANMKPVDPKWTKKKQEEHQRRQITLPQVMAVYGDLIKEYGRRPTTPPVSSSNGQGGAGGISTAGASAGA